MEGRAAAKQQQAKIPDATAGQQWRLRAGAQGAYALHLAALSGIEKECNPTLCHVRGLLCTLAHPHMSVKRPKQGEVRKHMSSISAAPCANNSAVISHNHD